MSPQKCANAENFKYETWTAAAAFVNGIFFFFSFLNETKSNILLISLVVILGLFVWLARSFSCIYLFLDTYVMLYIRITARSVFSSKRFSANQIPPPFKQGWLW